VSIRRRSCVGGLWTSPDRRRTARRGRSGARWRCRESPDVDACPAADRPLAADHLMSGRAALDEDEQLIAFEHTLDDETIGGRY
jgi:hypothetical protein